MRSALAVVLVLLAAAVVGCGSNSESSEGGGSDGDGSAKTAKQIKRRELAALPTDPNFVGKPVIHVFCDGASCIAHLTGDLAESIPLATDYWQSSPLRLEGGGSNIVGFMAADAHYECMNRMADTSSVSALEPCSEVIAHKQLP
jgi:hypothetical protein